MILVEGVARLEFLLLQHSGGAAVLEDVVQMNGINGSICMGYIKEHVPYFRFIPVYGTGNARGLIAGVSVFPEYRAMSADYVVRFLRFAVSQQVVAICRIALLFTQISDDCL